MAVIFRADMVSNLSEWGTLVVPSGNSLAWHSTAGRGGTGGMRVTLNNTDATYAPWNFTALTPAAGVVRSVTFNLTNFDLSIPTNGNYFMPIRFGAGASLRAYLLIIRDGGVIKARAVANRDAGGTRAVQAELGSAQWIQAVLITSTGASTENGHLRLYLDGELVGSLSNLDHYTLFDWNNFRAGFAFQSGTSPSSNVIDIGPVIVRDDDSVVPVGEIEDELTTSIIQPGREVTIYRNDSLYLEMTAEHGTAPYTGAWALKQGETVVDTFSGMEPGETVMDYDPGTYVLEGCVTDDALDEDCDQVDVTIQGVTVPDAPTIVVEARGPKKIYVWITAPGDTGGAPITSYLIYRRSPIGSGDYTLVDTVGYFDTTTRYTERDVLSEAGYEYVVEAVNEEGPGSASAPDSATTTAIVDVHLGFETDLEGLTPVISGGSGGAVTHATPGLLGTDGGVDIAFDEDTTSAYLPVTIDLTSSDEWRIHFARNWTFTPPENTSYFTFYVRKSGTETRLIHIQHLHIDSEDPEEQTGELLRAGLFDDNNIQKFSGEVNIEAQPPEWVEIHIRRSSADGVLDGGLDVYFGGTGYDHTVPTLSIENEETWDRWIDDIDIRLGFFLITPLTGIDPGAFRIDELAYNNTGEPIGPLGEDEPGEPGAALAQQRHWHAMIHG